MGSVGADYKCPLCGRIGNGGRALDGYGFPKPICTGEQSHVLGYPGCCDQLRFGERASCFQIVEIALVDVFCKRMKDGVAELIVPWLLGEEWVDWLDCSDIDVGRTR